MTPMEMTLLAKILWVFWVFAFFDFLTDFNAKMPKKTGDTLDIILGLTCIVTTIAVALLPFINLLWTYEQS